MSQATVTGVRNTGTFIGDATPTDPNDSRWVRTPIVSIPTETPSIFNQWLDQNIRYGASVNLQIPIYSRGQIKNGIKQAAIQQERATLQAQNVRNQLRQTIEQAYVDAKGAAKTFQANKVRANALTESTRIAEQRFTLGAINAVEYTLSQNNLAIAQSDMVRTKYEYVFRLKVLDFYMGKEIKLD
jgi:outer membrane protein